MKKAPEGEGPTLAYEQAAGFPSRIVAGVDEVGLGCIAGPVVAGAVVLPSTVDYDAHPWLREVTDSKQLSEEKREELAPLIQGWVRSHAIAMASVEEIDQINIYHAARLAMFRAVQTMSVQPEHVLVDGNAPPKQLHGRCTAIVKGDAKSLSIACASILAKVWRDRLMTEFDGIYPGYGLAKHKGYPTPKHKLAVNERGVLPIHRKSFLFIKEKISGQTSFAGI
ncbi:MAG: ribonuclease HII [Bacteriovoracia bacterium]